MKRAIRHAPLFLICLLAAVLWWELRVEAPMRAPRVTSETFDAFAYYYPTFSYAFDQVRHGRVPLWNPYQHCGTPLLASAQHMVYYPLNLFYILLPTPSAMKVTTILHFALAILFTYYCARSFRLRPLSALTAGIIFAFTPVFANNIYAPHHLYGSAWIPLHLGLLHRMLTRARKAYYAMLLGFAVAAQYLGGYPMHCLFSLYTMALYVLWFFASEWCAISWRRVGANLAALTWAGVLATLLALPQLIAAVELAPRSPRPFGGIRSVRMADPGYVAGWALPLETLAGTLLPTFNSVFASGISPSIGVVGIALVIVGIAFPRRRAVSLFFVLTVLWSAGLALGRHTPLYGWYFYLPTSDWFRVPNRFYLVTGFALAMLAGCGLDSLQRGRIGRVGQFVLLGLALLLAVTTSLLLLSATDYLAAIGQQLQGAPALPGATSFVGRIIGLSAYAWAASAWLAAYIFSRRRRLLVASMPVAVYLCLSVSFLNYAALPDTDPDLHTMPPRIVEFLRANQGYHRTYILPFGTLLGSQLLPPKNTVRRAVARPVAEKSGMMYHLYVVGDRENTYPEQFTFYASRMTPPEDVERVNRFLDSIGVAKEEGVPQGSVFVQAGAPNLKFLDLLGTRFIVEGPQTSFAQHKAPERFPLVFESDNVKVYRNTGELPRAFVVDRIEIIPEQERALDRLASADFDPMVSVILEQPPARVPDNASPPRADVQFVSYDATEVVLDVRTSAPGFVVLTDQYYLGWTAEVDRVPAFLHRADYLFRAVYIDAGDHRVVFRYRPWWARWGPIGAGCGLLLLAVGMVVERRTHRRRWREGH